jgi:type IV secretory pathway VirB2 component (pilin)
MQRKLALVTLLLVSSLLPVPVHATTGGSTLPFNDALTTIQDNLTGPTANTIIVVILIASLVTVGMTREGSWLKPLGGAVILCALIAKAASLPGILGLGAATTVPYAYLPAAVWITSFWVLTPGALIYLAYLLSDRSLTINCSSET